MLRLLVFAHRQRKVRRRLKKYFLDTSSTLEKEHMASANTLEFTDANFDAEVLKSTVPVLVDFWAEWCQPCRMLGPTIDQLAEETKGKLKVGKVDIDHHRNIAMQYGIQSIPTVFLFKQGQIVKKWNGLVSKAALTEAINAI